MLMLSDLLFCYCKLRRDSLRALLYFSDHKRTMMGTYPEKFDKGGISKLFINTEPFPYSGKVVSVSYYLAEANGALLLGIWRQVGGNTFTLLNKVELPTSNQGLNNQVLTNPMQFQTGEFFGFHTKAQQRTSVSNCHIVSQLSACNCRFLTSYYGREITDENLPIGVTVTLDVTTNRIIASMVNIEP